MSQAFIIMQIGNKELDYMCEVSLVTALEDECGLSAKRVDKHNRGGLLKSEIIDFINNSEIIIADLTNERPNCYLEVGYAMGAGKFQNLILTAREDHNPDSPNYNRTGPKVHFDLIGYDILFWDPEKLEDFKVELVKRIKRRQAHHAIPIAKTKFPRDRAWVNKAKENALTGLLDLQKISNPGYMEIKFSISFMDYKLAANQRQLLNAMSVSNIKTFGWPIGVVLNVEGSSPTPISGGIVAEVKSHILAQNKYDYWTIRKNGDFFLLKNLFEDEHTTDKIFFDTRIIRATEVLLFCANLYSQLGVPDSTKIDIIIRHSGLKNRVLSAAKTSSLYEEKRTSTVNEEVQEHQLTLKQIKPDIVKLVKDFTQPLFMLFDYFEPPHETYEELVNNFVAGKIV